MKKIAALLLALLTAVSITACAGSSEPAETGSPDVENSVTEEMFEPESSAAESEQENEPAKPGNLPMPGGK